MSDKKQRVIDGYAARTLDSGVRYHVLHYSADPEKAEDEGFQDFLRSLPVRERRLNYELDETVNPGTPFWEDYVDAVHCVRKGRAIPLVQHSAYYGGWDCGTARMPAFALAQLTPRSKQIQWIGEVVPDRPMAMETFAPKVLASLKAWLPGAWPGVVHFGDATVTTKGGNVEKSAQDVAKSYGILIRPVSNLFKSVDGREQSVIRLLKDFIACDGPQETWIPRMIYSEEGCPTLVAGMRGEYCVMPTSKGDEHGPGAIYEKEPAKNWFSHINDGHQYPCVPLCKILLGGGLQRKSYRRI